MMTGKILFKEQSYRMIGACFEVYKEKGNGFLEAVYQECLARELAEQEQRSNTNGSSINPFRVFRVFRSSKKPKVDQLTQWMFGPLFIDSGVIFQPLVTHRR